MSGWKNSIVIRDSPRKISWPCVGILWLQISQYIILYYKKGMFLSAQGQIILTLKARCAGLEFSAEIKNCYLPVVHSFTTKPATCILVTSPNRQERGIPGIKLLPNVQLIKQLVGWAHFNPPGSPSLRVTTPTWWPFSRESLGVLQSSGFHHLHDLFPGHRIRAFLRPSLYPCRSRFWVSVGSLFRHLALLMLCEINV